MHAVYDGKPGAYAAQQIEDLLVGSGSLVCSGGPR